jgi:hypothetical protein
MTSAELSQIAALSEHVINLNYQRATSDLTIIFEQAGSLLCLLCLLCSIQIERQFLPDRINTIYPAKLRAVLMNAARTVPDGAFDRI